MAHVKVTIFNKDGEVHKWDTRWNTVRIERSQWAMVEEIERVTITEFHADGRVLRAADYDTANHLAAAQHRARLLAAVGSRNDLNSFSEIQLGSQLVFLYTHLVEVQPDKFGMDFTIKFTMPPTGEGEAFAGSSV